MWRLEVGGMTLRVNHQPLQHDVAHQAQPVFREVVVDVTVNLVLIDMLRQQLRNDEEDVGVV